MLGTCFYMFIINNDNKTPIRITNFVVLVKLNLKINLLTVAFNYFIV